MLKTTQAKQSTPIRDVARSLVQNRKASEAFDEYAAEFRKSDAVGGLSIIRDDRELGWLVSGNSDWSVLWKGNRESKRGFRTCSEAKQYASDVVEFSEAPTCETPGQYKQGDWVLYKGKPRQVYAFYPFEPTAEYPAIVKDTRFDQVELIGIKKRLRTSEVQRMTVEAVTI